MEIDLPEGLQNFTIVQLHMKYRDSSGYLIITIQDVGVKSVFPPIFMVLRHRLRKTDFLSPDLLLMSS